MRLLSLFFFLPITLAAQSDSLPNDSLRRPSEFYVDLLDDEFEMSDFLRVDYFQEELFFVALNEMDSSLIEKYIPVPRDSSHWYGHVVNVYYPSADSNYMWDQSKFVGYSRWNDSLHVDTLYFRKPEFYHSGDLDYYTMSGFCEYRNKTRHGREVVYYSVRELDGLVITGPYYRMKAEGKWKDGLKHGKWRHYSVSGELTHIEKWRKGKLKHTRQKH